MTDRLKKEDFVRLLAARMNTDEAGEGHHAGDAQESVADFRLENLQKN